MKKTGLILEGGGTRGIYTAGVLDVFMEHNITFDGIMGVSAGAIHGASYKANQRGRSIRYYKKHSRDPRFMGIRNLLTTGSYVGNQFCYKDLPDIYDPFDYDTFAKTPSKFYVGVTDVATGRATYLRIKDMRKGMKLVRASASLPGLAKPVLYKGHMYLDGGCSDSIPLRAMQKKGYDTCVVVETRDSSYMKEPADMRLINRIYRNYPEFCHQLSLRHVIYNETRELIRKQERNDKVFVIRPSIPLSIGRLEKNPKKLQEIYDIGRKDAELQLVALRRYLAR